MQRLTWIDFGKGITIFFVLLVHVLVGIHSSDLYSNHDTFFYYSSWVLFMFIMPIFFFLSGFLYKSPNNIKEYLSLIQKKGIGLLLPYIVFSVLYVALQHFAKVNHLYSWNSLLKIFDQPIGYLWFLYALFFIFVLIGFFDIFKYPIYIKIIFYLSLYIISQLFKFPFFLSEVFSWLIPFCMGIFAKEYLHFFKKKSTFFISLICLIIGMIIQRTITLNWFISNPMTLTNFIPKIFTIPVFIYFFMNMKKDSIFYKYFEKLGSFSLIIYLVHCPAASIFRIIYSKLGITNYMTLLLLTLLSAWEFSILICYLTKKFKILQFTFYPYKFIKNILISELNPKTPSIDE